MRWFGIAGIALYVIMVLTAATLERKQTEAWGTVEPCTQAVEEIAEVVNERLGDQ